MRGSVAVLFTLLAIGCTPKGSFQGKVVHAITGQPMAGKSVMLKSDPPATDVQCQTFKTQTDDAGAFKVDGLCGDNTYKVEAADKEILVEGPESIKGDAIATQPVEIKAWPAPPTGVYVLAGDALTKQAASWKIEGKPALNTETQIFYPTELPNEAVRVAAGQYLVLSGDKTVEALQIQPLVESGPRVFGTSKAPEKSEAWSYIGTKFTSDTEFEAVTATPKTDKVIDLKKGEIEIRFIEGTAFPAGKYTIMPKNGKRAYIVEFIGG